MHCREFGFQEKVSRRAPKLLIHRLFTGIHFDSLPIGAICFIIGTMIRSSDVKGGIEAMISASGKFDRPVSTQRIFPAKQGEDL